LKNNKILIIEDEQKLAHMLDLELKHAGYEILLAQDGLSGLQTARDERPRLILLDIMLPQLDGYHICRMLKFDKSTQDIPIIVLTALSGQESKDKAKEVKADHYLTKPFEPQDLLAVIQKIVSTDSA
jgi:two-component system alkaline phosphatase synthesis response regulator PhoP